MRRGAQSSMTGADPEREDLLLWLLHRLYFEAAVGDADHDALGGHLGLLAALLVLQLDVPLQANAAVGGVARDRVGAALDERPAHLNLLVGDGQLQRLVADLQD